MPDHLNKTRRRFLDSFGFLLKSMSARRELQGSDTAGITRRRAIKSISIAPFDIWAILRAAIANAIWRIVGGILGLIGGALLGALIQLLIEAVIGSGADTAPTIAAIGGMVLGLCFPRIAKIFVEMLWALASFPIP